MMAGPTPDNQNPEQREMAERIRRLAERIAEAEQTLAALQQECKRLETDAAAGETTSSPAVHQPEPSPEPPPEKPAPAAAQTKDPEPEPTEKPKPLAVPPPLPPRKARQKKSRELSARPHPPTQTPPQPTEPKTPALEERIGAVWFNRLGLAALLIGFALLARWIHPMLQPWGKVAIAYGTAAVLFAVGKYFEDRLRKFAIPVMASSIALAFFTSYAAHFVPGMQCIGLFPSVTLMLVCAALLILAAERWSSEPSAGLAIVLGHAASYVGGSQADSFSLTAILLLTGTGVFLMVRHPWLPLGLFTVVATFASHALWAFQDRFVEATLPWFWLNIGFLSAYFILFFMADVLLSRRLHAGSLADVSPTRLALGRAAGPTALVLFTATALPFFSLTPGLWDHLYVFLWILGVLHLAIAPVHRKLNRTDYPFYVVAGVLYLTLGLFSCLEGLSLNMVLAAEALMLLILARRLRLWFLNPVAQLVLAVNFVHFWLTEAGQATTLPVYLGSLATASIYLVKARLEETWKPIDNEIPEPTWVKPIRTITVALLPLLGHLHAIGGTAIAVVQTVDRFGHPDSTMILAAIGLAVTGAMLALRSRILFCAAILFAGFATALLLESSSINLLHHSVESPAWLYLGAAVLVALSACASTLHRVSTGAAIAAIAEPILWTLACLSLATCTISLEPWLTTVPWVVGASLLLWLPLWLRGTGRETTGSDGEDTWVGPALPFFSNPGRAVWLALPVLIGVATHISIRQSTDPTIMRAWIEIAVGGGLLAATMCTARSALGLGLVTFIATQGLAPGSEAVGTDVTSMAWVILAGVAMLGLGHTAHHRKETQMAGQALGLAIAVCTTGWLWVFHGRDPGGDPFLLWTFAAGLLLAGLAACEIIWRADTAPAAMNRHHLVVAGGVAVAWAGLWAASAVTRLAVPGPALAHLLVMAILAGLAAAACRSTSLAAAHRTILLATHLAFYVVFDTGACTRDHFLLVGLLFAITWAHGFVLEGAAWRQAGRHPPSARAHLLFVSATGTGLLTLLLAWVATGHLGGHWFHGEGAVLLLRALPIACVFALAGNQRRPIHQVLTLAACVALVGTVIDATEPIGRVGAAYPLFVIAVFGLWIGLERLLVRQTVLHIPSDGAVALLWMRRALVVGGAGMVAWTLSRTSDVTGLGTTLTWSLLALAIAGLGFLWHDLTYRRTALAVFAIAILRIVFVDVPQLESFARVIAFFGLGVCLLLVSFLYSRFPDKIKVLLPISEEPPEDAG